MKLKYLTGIYLLAFFCAGGCGSTPKYLPVEQIPASNFDEIHIGKPYDLVYLNTFDAVNVLPNWVPDKTLKDDGLIRLQNTQFSRLNDADNRVIHIRLRRDAARQTSVFLDPESRRVIGADEVLAAIRKKLGVPTV